MRLDTVGKRMEAVEELIQRFGSAFGVALGPEFGHASVTELDALGI
jgi:tetrahydromethanopterin S-methyltransferase subunit G